jgi:hypothetical protein
MDPGFRRGDNEVGNIAAKEYFPDPGFVDKPRMPTQAQRSY